MDPELNGLIPFEAPETVREAIAAVGRTEDVRFSPDDRRLAIAGFSTSTLLLVDVSVSVALGRTRVRLSNPVTIASPDLEQPHGIDFVGTDHLVAANRSGRVVLLKVPPTGDRGTRREIRALAFARNAGFEETETPGSAAVLPRRDNRYDVFVCNNFAHHVTTHRLVLGNRCAVKRNRILLKARLNVPDGITVSPSRRWLAVSSHFTNSVMIYRMGKALGPATEPDGELKDAGFPHGVRFTGDGQFVLVADAGGPVVRVYRADADDWSGDREAETAVRVIGEADFLRGRHNPEEGGPKGIDVDSRSRVLVATCEEQPLVFFDLRTFLDAIPLG